MADDSEARISAIWALGSSGDSVRRATLAAAVRVERRGHPQDGRVRARRAAGRRAARHASHGAARIRPPTCAGMRRSRWRDTTAARRAGLRADARSRVRRADGQAATCAQTRIGSGGRRDDQRPARRCRAASDPTLQGTRSKALSQQDRSLKVRQAALEALRDGDRGVTRMTDGVDADAPETVELAQNRDDEHG